MRRHVVRSSLLLLTIVVLASSALLGWGVNRFHAPGPLSQPTAIVLAPGSSVAAIAARLQTAGVIKNPFVFRAGVRLSGNSRGLKAGEYAFAPRVSANGTMALLISGKTVVRRVTIPEGLTSAEIVSILRATEGLSGKIASIPAEGKLLPETYHFSFGDSRAELVRRMGRAMEGVLTELWANRAADLPFGTPREALVLASIVEKETSVAAERAHVAGVFTNRLRRGMRLQSDPTVAYAISAGQGPLPRPLTRTDLSVDSPFNTYKVKGLPPTPIANPGRAAIAAAVAPLATADLYFVADGSGGHAFARTLREHQRNVNKWRKHQAR